MIAVDWNCERCTFLNHRTIELCAMCGFDPSLLRLKHQRRQEALRKSMRSNRINAGATRISVSTSSPVVAVADLALSDDEDSKPAATSSRVGMAGDSQPLLSALDMTTLIDGIHSKLAGRAGVSGGPKRTLTLNQVLADNGYPKPTTLAAGVKRQFSPISTVRLLSDDDDGDEQKGRVACLTSTSDLNRRQSFAIIDLTGDEAVAGSSNMVARQFASQVGSYAAPWTMTSLRDIQEQHQDDFKMAQKLDEKERAAQKKPRHDDKRCNSDEELTRNLQDMEDDEERRRLGAATSTSFDVLAEHRKGIQEMLKEKAKGLKIRALDENPHSRVGSKLYNRFAKAWESVADKTIILAFHGTREANIDSICQNGLDPRYRVHQTKGPGEYFGKTFVASFGYCYDGSKMLVMAILIDKTGLTYNQEQVLVIHKSSHHIPLFVLTF